MKEKLCYVEGNIAYFTTQDLDKQWGDDWDDAPYEHNAGLPYLPSVYYYADGRSEKNIRDWNKDGTPKWEIIKVMFEADLYTPCNNAINSPYSVQDINNGKVAWLKSFNKEFYIYAGVSIKEFKRLVELSGGNIYLKE